MPQSIDEPPAPSREDALRDLPVDEELEEGPLTGPPLRSRRDARELVLKIMYSHEISGEGWKTVMDKLLPRNEDKYYHFAEELCVKIDDGGEQIDQLIITHSEKWDFNRIAVIDKLILQMAIAEILFFPDIPPKVTINEAIEIAKRYSTVNSSRFVNGILDAVYNDLRKDIKKVDPPKSKHKSPTLKG